MKLIVWICAALFLVAALQGCTIHFKASEVELDAERQRVQKNVTYELDSMSLFDG